MRAAVTRRQQSGESENGRGRARRQVRAALLQNRRTAPTSAAPRDKTTALRRWARARLAPWDRPASWRSLEARGSGMDVSPDRRRRLGSLTAVAGAIALVGSILPAHAQPPRGHYQSDKAIVCDTVDQIRAIVTAGKKND